MGMFCFQCEQTVGGRACVDISNCGKDVPTSDAQDRITYELMKLAVVAEGSGREAELALMFTEALFTTVTNVSFDAEACTAMADRIAATRSGFDGGEEVTLQAIGGPESIFTDQDAEASLRALLVLGLRGMAAYAYHAHVLGFDDVEVNSWLVSGLAESSRSHRVERWLELLHDFGMVNFRCLELLDTANTSSYGHPAPVNVSMEVQPGPFIVVTGHDLHDLKMLAEQCEPEGVSIYTHGEMLPGHAYPELAKYSCLKGHFGTAWQNQRKEFAGVPGAFLFTTNCLMPPLPSYADNIFTTAVVAHPGLSHIDAGTDGIKDFSPVITKAKELGGWPAARSFSGINGGTELTTGFGHNAVLGVADVVVDAIKAGDLKHIYVVGGCDGALHGRNYFTELVENTPDDSVVLTLACGKFRFNDLQLGTLGGLPRLLDMGQCNDAYSAVKVASALAEAFGVGINDLPLSLVLSWYEQKAVCVLLTLLALGVKNIYLGPTLPGFVSPEVLDVLVSEFGLRPTSTVGADLATMRPSLV